MKNLKYIILLTAFTLSTNLISAYPTKSSKTQNNFISRNKGLVITSACVISGVIIYLIAYYKKDEIAQSKINILKKENSILNKDKINKNQKNTPWKDAKDVLTQKLNLLTNDIEILTKKLQEEYAQEETKEKETDDKQKAPNTIDYTIFIPTPPKQVQTFNKDSTTDFSETDQQETKQYIDPENKTVDDPKMMANGLMAKGVKIATETLTEASGELLKNIIFPDNARAHSMGIPDSELIARETKTLFVSDFQLTKPDWKSQVFGKDPMRSQKNHPPALIVSSNIC